jgi:membrane dipeptidase
MGRGLRIDTIKPLRTDADSAMTNHRKLSEKFLIIDGHADTPQRFVDEGWSFSDPLRGGMINLESAMAGGLTAEFLAIWVDPKEWSGRYAQRTLQLIEGVREQVRKHAETMRLGLTAADVVKAHEDGVFCALMGIEGGHSIENKLENLREFYKLGVRYMTLTWSITNEWADSSGDMDDASVQHHGGLSAFGREVVREMNRLGMMVDVSHVSDATLAHVLETTSVPVIASHSSSRVLTDTPRNLTDDQLRAIAQNGGLVMVNFYPPFIDGAWTKAWLRKIPERDAMRAAVAAPYRERGEPVPFTVTVAADRAFYEEHLRATLPLTPLSTLVDHIDHVARVAGIDHVGIGSDFDGIQFLPEGLDSAADLPKITDALTERGYTAEQLQKLLGGNLLRVFGAVQAAAE